MELKVGAVATGGGCVARAPDGRVVFVRHCLPGELVSARVTSSTSSFLRADAVTILEPSPHRVTPPCPFAGPGRCGGCDWQHVEPAMQRRLKADLIAEHLRRQAGIDAGIEVEELPGSADGLGWRTRVRFAADRRGRIGLRRHRSHQIEPVDRCLIAHPAVEAAGVEDLRWPGEENVEVVASPDDGTAVVVLDGGRRGRRPAPAAPALAGVTAGVVVGHRTVREPGALIHRVSGRRFRVSAGVFWQVHPAAAATLADAVVDGLAPVAGESAVDLYAGSGLFAAVVAERVGTSGSVLAVERSRLACADAQANTADLPQVTVVRSEVTADLVAGRIGTPDLIVLDPAREGAGRDVAASLVSLDPPPRRLAYVACDPASFARDLRVFVDAGWSPASMRAFDLFPMTEHVEIVAVLEPPAR